MGRGRTLPNDLFLLSLGQLCPLYSRIHPYPPACRTPAVGLYPACLLCPSLDGSAPLTGGRACPPEFPPQPHPMSWEPSILWHQSFLVPILAVTRQSSCISCSLHSRRSWLTTSRKSRPVDEIIQLPYPVCKLLFVLTFTSFVMGSGGAGPSCSKPTHHPLVPGT